MGVPLKNKNKHVLKLIDFDRFDFIQILRTLQTKNNGGFGERFVFIS